MNKRSRITATISMVVFLPMVLTGCQKKQSREEALFRQGRDLVRSGHYAEAIEPLERFQREHPHAPLASNAGLFLGKAFLALGRFEEAQNAWQRTIQHYPGSLEDHKCRYKLAMLALLQENETDALHRFASLAEAPDGPLAAEATAFRTYLENRLGDRVPGGEE